MARDASAGLDWSRNPVYGCAAQLTRTCVSRLLPLIVEENNADNHGGNEESGLQPKAFPHRDILQEIVI